MKKIIVLGSGAIGSVFAALLSKKNDVLIVGRKEHVEKINKDGLQLTENVNKKFYLKATTKINSISSDTIILLTVKAHETEQTIINIRNKIKDDTIIVCIQNGLGSDEIVRNLVSCKVVRAVTMIGSIFLKNGVVQVTTLENTFISDKEKIILDLFSDSNIPIKKTKNINKIVWEKLVINCVINGLGSVLRVKNNQLQSKYLKDIKIDIVKECIAVAKKEGVTLKTSIYKTVGKIIRSSTNINSILQDLLKHKKTEIDFLNGAVVNLGKKHNIKTPVNEMILNIIKTSENL